MKICATNSLLLFQYRACWHTWQYAAVGSRKVMAKGLGLEGSCLSLYLIVLRYPQVMLGSVYDRELDLDESPVLIPRLCENTYVLEAEAASPEVFKCPPIKGVGSGEL